MYEFSNPLGSSDAARFRFNIGAAASGINTDITSVVLTYGGLKIKDSDSTNAFQLLFPSNITSDRFLKIITGDADRTITINGDVTLGAHALLDGAQNSDTLASGPVRGGIITANSTPLWAQLALGGSGTLLRSNGTDLAYSTATYPNTVTAGDILIATGSNAIGSLAVGATAGQLVRSTGTAPAYSAIAYTDTATSGGIPYYSSTTAVSSSALLTNHALIIGGGAGATPKTIAALTNGQLAIGSTGADPVPATLTAAGDVSITNAAGSITIGNLTNADTGACWMIPDLSQSAAVNSTVDVANVVRFFRFYLPFRLSMTAIDVQCTASGGGTVGLGIYNSDGTSLLASGTFAAGTGTKSVTFTAVLLNPGFYIFAHAVTVTSTRLAGATMETTSFTVLFNATVAQMGTAATAASAGTLPASLGTLTGVNAEVPVLAKIR